MANNSLVDLDCDELQSGFEKVEKNGIGDSSSFICPIYQCIARDPIEFRCCRHWYCCYCFMEYNQHPNSRPSGASLPHLMRCAFCRQEINVHYKTTAFPLVSRQIAYSKLRVSCSFRCGKVGAPYKIRDHELFYCEKRPLRCPFPGCPAIFDAAHIVDHIGDCTMQAFYCPKCFIATPVDFFPWHSCITTLHQIISFLTQANNQLTGIKWTKGRPGEFVYSPKALEKKVPMEWYETNIASFTKQKANKIQLKKQGLFDERPRSNVREVQAPPSSPIQLDRQNAIDESSAVNLQIPAHVSDDSRRWSITSNAGSDNEELDGGGEVETFQVVFLLNLLVDSESAAF